MRALFKAIVAGALTWPFTAASYDTVTHQLLSQAALGNSKIGQSATPLADWGMNGALNTNFFPQWSNPATLVSADQLLYQVGPVAEDNVDSEEARPLRHFYDPTQPAERQGLQCTSADDPANSVSAISSPDWAINGIGQSDPRDYSFARARKAMQAAFTSQTQDERNANFGLMFEAVGHVIHHIQDMAQPQHVRNDAHLELPGALKYLPAPVNNPSKYEQFVAAHSDMLSFFGYDNVQLPSPRDYWTNSNPAAPVSGMATFTNFNFVSQGSNFQMISGSVAANAKYTNPAPVDVDTEDINRIFRIDGSCPSPNEVNPNPTSKDPKCSVQGEMDFVVTQVYDSLLPGAQDLNYRAAAYSIFDQDLQAHGTVLQMADSCYPQLLVFQDRAFTVNELTFPDAMDFLIPRAVAYSAGMIDYFFRGQIDLTPKSDSDPTLVFTNRGPDRITGTVTLYYDAEDGNRYPVPNGTWQVSDLDPQGTMTPDPIPTPDSPPPKDIGVYMMVFNGTMGGESPIGDGPGAVAAKLVKIPLPELYVSQNEVNNFNGADFATFDLFYNVPKQFEALVRDNFASTHLKVNRSDYPPTNPANVDQCGYPSVFITGQKLGYFPQNSDFFEWSAMFFQGNQVLWSDRVGDVAVATSEPDVAAQLEPRGYEPQCGTEILLNDMPNPYQNTRIEYYIGNQLLFGLCYRYEITADNSLNLVVSNLSNLRVRSGALRIRHESPATLSCP